MKLLVTGGSGRLGRWVVEELRSDHEVVVAGLEDTPPPDAVRPGVRYEQADLTDAEAVARVAEGAEAIVHLAAIPSPIGREPEDVFANNMTSTFNVVEAAIRQDAQKVIYSSSGSALGFAFRFRDMVPDYMPMDEEHPLRPQDAYGLSKWLGEEILEAATRRTGIRTIVLRPTSVIGPEDYAERVPRMLDNGGGILAYVDRAGLRPRRAGRPRRHGDRARPLLHHRRRRDEPRAARHGLPAPLPRQRGGLRRPDRDRGPDQLREGEAHARLPPAAQLAHRAGVGGSREQPCPPPNAPSVDTVTIEDHAVVRLHEPASGSIAHVVPSRGSKRDALRDATRRRIRRATPSR